MADGACQSHDTVCVRVCVSVCVSVLLVKDRPVLQGLHGVRQHRADVAALLGQSSAFVCVATRRVKQEEDKHDRKTTSPSVIAHFDSNCCTPPPSRHSPPSHKHTVVPFIVLKMLLARATAVAGGRKSKQESYLIRISFEFEKQMSPIVNTGPRPSSHAVKKMCQHTPVLTKRGE